MNFPTPQPDPALVQQQQQAQRIATQQIQTSLGQQTENLWSLFGQGSQLSYINLPPVAAAAAPAPAPAAGNFATAARG